MAQNYESRNYEPSGKTQAQESARQEAARTMDEKTARRMSELTTEFYARANESFSATRQAPWPGWDRVLDICELRGAARMRVLDLACGNLRFERFLADYVDDLRVWAADNCDALVGSPAEFALEYQHLNIAENPTDIVAPPCDLAVSFGFMHHLPLRRQRRAVLKALADHTRPGGYVVVTFWQFAKNSRLLAKARPVRGGDKGDYLLGWQDRTDVARYCHSFSEDEIDALVASLGNSVEEVARFSADGKTGDLNRYLVLRTSTVESL